ncbi:MAG: TonB-dependent receptor, partial [Bacteroidota bacterium]
MRITHWLTAFFLLFLATTVQAQTTISGDLRDEEGAAVPGATVRLLNDPDLTVVTGALSNEAGHFDLKAAPGKYQVKIELEGYVPAVVPDIEVGSLDMDLGKIRLAPKATELDAVQITAERQLMELKLDKRIYNVEADITNRGANAAEILENIPSVEVDTDGNVSLRGSQNVRILVDGKQSALVGISGTDALRQLQGDQIEKIEVVTNPSARYDAEGDVGIINLVMKKQKRRGLNGTVNARLGGSDNYYSRVNDTTYLPYNFGGGFNLNFRTNKVNLFTGYSVGWRRSQGGGENLTRFTYPDTSYGYDQISDRFRGGFNQTIRAGMDIFLGPQSTVTFTGTFRNSNGDHRADISYEYYDELGDREPVIYRTEEEGDVNNTQTYQIDYEKKFKRKGQIWKLSGQFSDNWEHEEADQREWSVDPNYERINQRTISTDVESNYVFQTDFILPLGEEGKFETGAKAQLRSLDNEY